MVIGSMKENARSGDKRLDFKLFREMSTELNREIPSRRINRIISIKEPLDERQLAAFEYIQLVDRILGFGCFQRRIGFHPILEH